jgi:hypothetical protein
MKNNSYLKKMNKKIKKSKRDGITLDLNKKNLMQNKKNNIKTKGIN